jgi:hypothetical protein
MSSRSVVVDGRGAGRTIRGRGNSKTEGQAVPAKAGAAPDRRLWLWNQHGSPAAAGEPFVRLAAACTAYKAKHGKYPEKVAGLAPEFVAEVPLDPYDGRPLRLRRVKGGVVLYSIGRDRKDDGGLAWDEKKQQGDLVFRLR